MMYNDFGFWAVSIVVFLVLDRWIIAFLTAWVKINKQEREE